MPVTASAQLKPNDTVEMKFSDGSANAIVTGGKTPSAKPRQGTAKKPDKRQGSLL